MTQPTNWLDEGLGGYSIVHDDGTPLPQENILDIVGADSIVDDPVNGRTIVTLPTGPSQATIPLSNGLNSDVPVSGQSSIRFGSYSGPIILGGLALMPAPTPGQVIDLQFTVVGQPVTIRNLDAGSLAANRISTGTGADVLLPVGGAPSARLVWQTTTSKWHLQLNGVHQDTTANVLNFGADPTGTNDSAPAINAAIASLGSGGGDVVLPGPASTYLILSPIVLGTPFGGIHIRGEGVPNGDLAQGTTIVAGAAMYTMLSIRGSTNKAANLYLDGAQLANYCVAEEGASNSTLDHVWGFNAIFDSCHQATGRLCSVGPVTPAGGNTSPAITAALRGNSLTYGTTVTVTITSTGSHTLASGSVRASCTIQSYTGDQGIPSTGVVQFPIGYLVSGSKYIGLDPGFAVTFPAGTYAHGDSWTIAFTRTETNNDTIMHNECNFSYSGSVYASGAFYPSTSPPWTGTTVRFFGSAVTGTVSCTSGSNLITGTGTSFLSLGARSGDFIWPGTFPFWQASHSYTVGDLIWAATPNGDAPGCSYIFQCLSTGTSGGSLPFFPFYGNEGVDANGGVIPVGTSPVGLSIISDGGTSWLCLSHSFFQIQTVLDDTHVIVNGIADSTLGPQFTRSGMDYSLCVGSGFYAESNSNNSNATFIKGFYQNNAAAGIKASQTSGWETVGSFVQRNGVCGIGVGLDSELVAASVILHPYFEGNQLTAVYLGGALGISIIEASGAPRTAMYMVGGGNVYGSVIGNVPSGSGSTNPLTHAPITSLPSSELPVVYSSSLFPFYVQGPFVRKQGPVQSLAPTSTIAVQANGSVASIIPFASSPTSGTDATLTSTPSIALGFRGQEIELVNIGSDTLTLVSDYYPNATGVVLDQPKISLGLGDRLKLRYGQYYNWGYFWMQLEPVFRAAVPGKGPIITLTNGVNADIQTWGLTRLEVAGPTGSFSIAGVAPFSQSADPYGSFQDGLDLTIINFLNQTMTVSHEDSGDESTATSRIWCPGGTDLVIAGVASDYTYVHMRYNASKSRWIVLDHS